MTYHYVCGPYEWSPEVAYGLHRSLVLHLVEKEKFWPVFSPILYGHLQDLGEVDWLAFADGLLPQAYMVHFLVEPKTLWDGLTPLSRGTKHELELSREHKIPTCFWWLERGVFRCSGITKTG